MARRNSDAEIRDAERRFRQSGEFGDCLRWAKARARAGEISADYVDGERPWNAGLPLEHRGPDGTRQRIWEASLCSGEEVERTAFFGFDTMGFKGQLEAVASPSAYRLAVDAISEMNPQAEFVMASHPDAPSPAFRLVFLDGRVGTGVYRPTENPGDMRRQAERDFAGRGIEHSPGWWRPWNPANYPSMVELAMSVFMRLPSRKPAATRRNSDDRFRALVRELAATSDPNVAGRLLFEAVRAGRWLTPRDLGGDWNENTYRIGTLRFLAYLGWKDAIELLERLPLDQTGVFDKPIQVRGKGHAVPTAFGEIGPEVAKMIAPTVLSAAAAAGCMAVARLIPEYDAGHALTLFGEARAALYRHEARGEVDRAESDRLWAEVGAARSKLYGAGPPRASEFDRLRGGMSPGGLAIAAASNAWSRLIGAMQSHPSDQSKQMALAIFEATHALAWECEPDYDDGKRPVWRSVEWLNLPENHWMRASRLRIDWRDPWGARPSTRCMKVAKKAMREAMLGPALVAAATLVQ